MRCSEIYIKSLEDIHKLRIDLMQRCPLHWVFLTSYFGRKCAP